MGGCNAGNPAVQNSSLKQITNNTKYKKERTRLDICSQRAFNVLVAVVGTEVTEYIPINTVTENLESLDWFELVSTHEYNRPTKFEARYR